MRKKRFIIGSLILVILFIISSYYLKSRTSNDSSPLNEEYTIIQTTYDYEVVNLEDLPPHVLEAFFRISYYGLDTDHLPLYEAYLESYSSVFQDFLTGEFTFYRDEENTSIDYIDSITPTFNDYFGGYYLPPSHEVDDLPSLNHINPRVIW